MHFILCSCFQNFFPIVNLFIIKKYNVILCYIILCILVKVSCHFGVFKSNDDFSQNEIESMETCSNGRLSISSKSKLLILQPELKKEYMIGKKKYLRIV